MLDSTVATNAPLAQLASSFFHMGGAYGHDAVPVQLPPVSSTDQSAVRAAIERDAQIKAAFRTRSLSCSRCVEPQPALILIPSGS